jgi:hypothetical protein
MSLEEQAELIIERALRLMKEEQKK